MWKRLTVLWSVARHDARQLWFALRHPAAPGWLKLGSALIVLYVLSPIDLIPDPIPILGVLDDIVIVPLAIRWLLSRLPAELRNEAARRAGPRSRSAPGPGACGSNACAPRRCGTASRFAPGIRSRPGCAISTLRARA